VITQLKEEGYDIESVTRKGYCLKSVPDILTQEEIGYYLKTKQIGKQVLYHPQIGSTNEEAKRQGAQGVKHGTVIIADEQVAGKGRLGRNWSSPPGTGIWMSILLRPELQPVDAPKITLVAGLAVCKAVEKVTGLCARIKWPNDIVIQGKKVCGILTEMSAEMEQVNYIVLGIGMNVNTEGFPEEIGHIATSLRLEGNKKYCRKELVSEIFHQFEAYYEAFLSHENLSPILEKYKKFCVTLGREVQVIRRQDTFRGMAEDIDMDGNLVVQKENGERVSVFSGEVSVRGIYCYV
jgi:BirA family biotin operon repressor/biotin-[acetyl-CoA-carboxylase] ligase